MSTADVRAFHIRAILEPDYYFVLVRSWRSLSVGDYTLHIEPVVNPSDSSDTPTQLELSVPHSGPFRRQARDTLLPF